MINRVKKSVLLIGIMTLLSYTGCGASDTKMSSSVSEMNYVEYADKTADGIKSDAGDYDAADAEFDGFAEDDIYRYDEVAPAEAPELNAAGEIVPEDAAVDDDFASMSEPVSGESRIGMLTAGEWRDNDNWGFFQNLVNTGLVQFSGFDIDPTQRIAVTVTNPDGEPLPNVSVWLEQNDDTILWQSVTDKNGRAYLFESNQQSGAKIIAQQDTVTQIIALNSQESATDEQGMQMTSSREFEIVLETEKKLYANTEIMFIVDTTGSMGDEMLFLQSDFSAIAEETGDENTLYSVNFYKDTGDEYVTKCFGFTGDVQAIKNQLCAESASGGGDEPEAVAEILGETLSGNMWSTGESVKIAFLIYDAPPHDNQQEILKQAVADASAKGIHLVPVVSSNSSRETELFGRAIAICTNGSYVFLTDDSGIGDSHLEPIIGDYEVESLHDIIVRIIRDYKQV